jgi:hypothetical protein
MRGNSQMQLPPERPDRRGPLHSVVGLTKAEEGSLDFREYIVYTGAQSLPQFAIWYRHRVGCSCSNCVV